MEVKLVYTTRLKHAVQLLASNTSHFNDQINQFKEIQNYLESNEKTHLQVKHIKTLSTLYQSIIIPNQLDTNKTREFSCGLGYFHELIRDSSIYLPPPPLKQRNPEFLAFLERMKVKYEQAEYRELVKDLPGNKNTGENSMGSEYAAAQRELGTGVNILTLMLTGFIVFYYFGSSYFPNNHIYSVGCGLIGLVAALMVEISLFLVREQKKEIRMNTAELNEQKEKMKNSMEMKRKKNIEERLLNTQKQMEKNKENIEASAEERKNNSEDYNNSGENEKSKTIEKKIENTNKQD